MRFLLEPANNTLSHLAKCLAIREGLLARGHEVVVAAAAGRSPFLAALGVPHEVLPDIQEADHGASPSFAWFRAERFEACVRAELDLLARVRPDRVLGVFRFTGGVSAAIAGVPYDALICGCMTPACAETLGFAPGEPGEREQAEALAFFRGACARRVAPVLRRLGRPPVDDAWALLLGQRTYLWDVPEFQPLRPHPDLQHVGHLPWSGWPSAAGSVERLAALPDPLAVVSLGTGAAHRVAATFIVDLLLRLGFSVAFAAGGPLGADWPRPGPRFAAFDFLPVEAALRRAAVVACHGGQGLVLEALRGRLPVLVVPFQPEQSQNGRCLERLGAGLRLVRHDPFGREAGPIEAALVRQDPAALAAEVGAFLARPGVDPGRAAVAEALARAGGLPSLVAGLERAP